MKTRKVELDYGCGMQDVFLNLKKREIYYTNAAVENGHTIPEEFKPHFYYTSRSGLSGAGYAHFPDHVIKVNSYYLPNAYNINRITKAMKLGNGLYASIYIPCLPNVCIGSREIDEPMVLVLQQDSDMYSPPGNKDTKHILVTTTSIDDIFNLVETASAYGSKNRDETLYDMFLKDGIGKEKYMKYSCRPYTPEGSKWNYLHVSGLNKEPYWFLEKFLDSRWMDDQTREVSEIHETFRIRKGIYNGFCFYKALDGTRTRAVKYLGEEDPLFIPEIMENIGAECLKATKKTAVYIWKKRIIGIVNSSLGLYEYEIEYPSKEAVYMYPELYAKKVLDGAKEKILGDLERKRKIANEEKAICNLPDNTVITFQDSIDSGNCEVGTKNFQEKYFPDKKEVTAGELKKHIGLSNVRRVLLHVASKLKKAS